MVEMNRRYSDDSQFKKIAQISYKKPSEFA
jgi:hypothetical protein